ncbi:hypothetical protein R1flu_025229 [Riccia fluitans]|uniref:DUF7869 domain-containing protein n=1 Tax=Riccia fluitans TaxID=41844 RepID=A0ABD1XX58_9MARC
MEGQEVDVEKYKTPTQVQDSTRCRSKFIGKKLFIIIQKAIADIVVSDGHSGKITKICMSSHIVQNLSSEDIIKLWSLMVNHKHEDVDATFSKVAHRTRHKDVLTLLALMAKI